ncbi:MAG: hypothetical protein WCG47_34195 [Dermatophilaceae bacterium]
MTAAGTDPQAGDLALLRRFEPVLRYTRGEMFLPTSVEAYVGRAALVRGSGSDPQVLTPHGALDVATLVAAAGPDGGRGLSLRSVRRPMDRREYRAWLRTGARPRFVGTSAAAAVGLTGRVAAATVRLSLWLRGNVPGGWAAAAYADSQAADENSCYYYGHVSRDGGYIVLQYWFLYAMNDWRSSFGGVNDHEADWEQMTLFLAPDDGSSEPSPRWVAFSSHDETGADLRRNWDDPDLDRLGEHPVVYVGAGSHSGAYLAGDYLVTVAPNLPHWLTQLRRHLLRILPWFDPEAAAFGIPYVDYRRGNGVAVGPGQEREWDATLVDDATPWLAGYRGLWGLDTSDPLGGERAPAGPRYERDGTVRRSWGQPVAWAALDGEPPTPADAAALWAARPQSLRDELTDLQPQLQAARAALRAATVADRVAGLQARETGAESRRLSDRVAALRRRQSLLRADLEVALGHAAEAVPQPAAHAHLHHRAVPLSPDARTRSAWLRVWAAVSSSVLFAALGLLLLSGETTLLVPISGLLALMIVVESVVRGRLLSLALRVAATLVVVIFVWLGIRLFVDTLRAATGIILVLAAAYLVFQTVREAASARAVTRGKVISHGG